MLENGVEQLELINSTVSVSIKIYEIITLEFKQ